MEFKTYCNDRGNNGREKYTEAIKFLNDSIQYREAVSSYSLKEIHKYLCDEEDHTKNPPITDKGKDIKHHIFTILNYFEYIAVGVNNNVYTIELKINKIIQIKLKILTGYTFS